MNCKSIVINSLDNIAVATEQLAAGEVAYFGDSNEPVILLNDIPMGHKFALCDIKPGEPIYKYGQIIGVSCRAISKGEHIHVHNIESQRGRGDRA